MLAWLAGLAPSRRRAWDCACGPGQAAVSLARHFERVVATEASLDQLAQPFLLGDRNWQARVSRVRSLAERSGLAPGSVDLVTVAQALHWLDFDAFWSEVRRVLVPGGAVAVWGYGLLTVEPKDADPEKGGRVEALLHRYYRQVVGPYWPPERRHIEERYRSIPFPFEELPVPRVVWESVWTREHLLGYLGTWSAGKRYREAREEDPRDRIAKELAAIWPEGEGRRVRWELFVRVGRNR